MRDLRSGPPRAGSGAGEVITRAPTKKGGTARGKVTEQNRKDLQTLHQQMHYSTNVV